MHRLLSAVVFLWCVPCVFAQTEVPYADLVEADFPFIATTVDADDVAPFSPPYNGTVRGIVIQLGHETYLCFDPDLLRMAAAWEGEFVSMTTMAQISYHRLDKANAQPRLLGSPIAAGFEQEMPSFRGILEDADVESIILFIQSLDVSHGGDE